MTKLSSIRIERGDLKNLGTVCYDSCGRPWAITAKRQVSAMVLVGVTSKLQLSNLRRWWKPTPEGAFSVGVGPAMVAFHDDFSDLTNQGTVNTRLPEWNDPGVTNVDYASRRTPPWNDAIESYKWVT